MDLNASGATCFFHSHAMQDGFALGLVVRGVCASHA
jgi:FtsP/CotA-like multicopper oxidase with cupredoxin domain